MPTHTSHYRLKLATCFTEYLQLIAIKLSTETLLAQDAPQPRLYNLYMQTLCLVTLTLLTWSNHTIQYFPWQTFWQLL